MEKYHMQLFTAVQQFLDEKFVAATYIQRFSGPPPGRRQSPLSLITPDAK